MRSYSVEQVTHIARTCHQVNKALCEAFGDMSQLEWEDAPEWQKSSAVQGVSFCLSNPDAPPSANHENWLKVKELDGWKWGPIKDVDAKEHPCFLPYEKLPPDQKAKDYVFKAIVLALS